MFNERSTATSSRMLAKFSSVTMTAIHGNDECLFAELRDVLKNPAQVCELHGRRFHFTTKRNLCGRSAIDIRLSSFWIIMLPATPYRSGDKE